VETASKKVYPPVISVWRQPGGVVANKERAVPSLFGSEFYRIEATETNDELKGKQLMDEILQYNREGFAGTWAVFEWLRLKAPALNIGRPKQ
jgi:hypothetical protein